MRLTVLALVLAAQTATPIFRFETDGFWLNLHHYLHVLGQVEARMPDIKREAVVRAPDEEAAGLKGLSDTEHKAWRESVTFYATGLSKLSTTFDRQVIDVTNSLRRAVDDKAASVQKVDPAVAAALDRAAPIYRKVWWTKHRDSNRAWVKGMQDPLERYGPQVLAYVTRAYQEPWEKGGYPVNVSGYANWAGAYSTSFNLLVVASLNPGNAGLHGFEITFHEAMHQWDEEIDARLMTIAKANNLKFDDLLSHAMIFYTTGEAVKSVVPGHVSYAEMAGIWKGRMGAFKPALDAHWKPYLAGKGTLDEALLAVLKG